MEYPNLISAKISSSDLKEIINAINFIHEKLPELATLSHEELSALPKMRHGTIKFVLENLKEANEHPNIVPKNVDVVEIIKDVELVAAINKILDPINKLKKKLEEIALVAESEAYLPSIAIHNAIRADQIRRRYKRKTVNA